jgi:hypothetical protein
LSVYQRKKRKEGGNGKILSDNICKGRSKPTVLSLHLILQDFAENAGIWKPSFEL